MHDDARRAAAALLAGHWREGTRLTALPEPLRPATRAEGYAIQAFLEQPGAPPLFGWKIAATSAAGQKHIAVDGPLAGRILAERVRPDGGAVSLQNSNMRVAEVEFAFRFGQDLPPCAEGYRQEAVLAAVASLHPAIEIPDSRYSDFTVVGAAQLIADNACAHEFILGAAAPEGWRALDLAAYRVQALRNGREAHEGIGANVLGDPRIALTWLVNELSGLGTTLRAGEVVTTGTCLVPVPVSPGDRIEADYGVLGQVSARFI